jgi:hypothetical protein
MHRPAIPLLLSAVMLTSCAAYAPPTVDPKTGLIGAMASLDEGAIQVRNTNVDLRKFRFVHLSAGTNVYPARFEFFVRAALDRAGFRHVLNTNELTQLVTSDPKLAAVQSINDPVAQRRLSELAGPILRIDFRSQWDGNVRRYVTLSVVDLSTGNELLRIHNPKTIWMEVDSEAHYPVLNEFQKWVDACVSAKGGPAT